MILVGNQRGGARELAIHLLKEENDHVEVHELRGFAARDLAGALNEVDAISRGTRCRRYLFSLSLNPPVGAHVGQADFETAIDRIEERLGLSGQPRAVVFHEKAGRRHAHCIWSRIRAGDMKAIQLSFTNNRLMEVARDLYIEHGWKMPRGLTKAEERDPRNFTLAEWQQAKRLAKDPKVIKSALQDAWAISGTARRFRDALKDRGYYLAHGDRRSFVVIDELGEIYSLPRWLNVESKDVAARLDTFELPTIGAAKQQLHIELTPVLAGLQRRLFADLRQRNAELRKNRESMVMRQRQARQVLAEQHERRRWEEASGRQARFRNGLKGLWDWARGETKRVRLLNQAEAEEARLRDIGEKDALVFAHLREQEEIRDLRSVIAKEFALRSQGLKDDIRAHDSLLQPRPDELSLHDRTRKRTPER